MCDYSLMMLSNRLAQAGEELIAHRFQTGSTGFVSVSEWSACQARTSSTQFWPWLKEFFLSRPDPAPVVCIPPGARLRLESVSPCLRKQFDLEATEDVMFTQISADLGRYRDALCFGNGITVLLQVVPAGQRAKVLRLSSEESTQPEHELLQPIYRK
jgi:hypothetical protein